jgi:protein TonB
MFEQALLESARHSLGARRTYSTVASVLLQGAALATLFVAPLIVSHAVPTLQERTIPLLRRFESLHVSEQPSGGDSGASVVLASRPLVQPSQIVRLDRNAYENRDEMVALHPTTIGPNPRGLDSVIGVGRGPVLPEDPAIKHPAISVLEQGVVISRVQPLYPQIAVINRIQGTVHLNALITAGGKLEELHVLSGHPMLAQAAIDAVRQWRFRPYVLNGFPIEVQTEVIVNFRLD